MMIDRRMFLQLIIKELGLYPVFNGLRDALFYQLALQSRVPIPNGELPNILFEAEELTDDQITLIKKEVPKPDAFRHYTCDFECIRVHYFVNVALKDYTEEEPISKHIQEIRPNMWSSKGDLEEPEDGFVSVIVLHENHPKRTNANYPMIIKHELAHAAIQAVIEGDIDLMQFYFAEENSQFIEFVCDITPYISNSAKKENGINKYMDDAPILFGYDAGETMGEYIQLVREIEEQHQTPFKSTAEKYAFFLLETDGKTRMKFLGVNRMMYTSSTTAKRWKESIEAGLEDGELSDSRKEDALKVLHDLYQRMTE